MADLNNAVVWKVSTRPLIFKSSSPFTNPSVTVPRAPTATCITVTFMYHGFFNSLTRSRYLSFFSLSFSFTLLSAGKPKPTILQVFIIIIIIIIIIIRSGHRVEIRWSVCMSKSWRSSCASFSRTDSGSCLYHFFVWSNSKFLHSSQWITLPIQLSLVLYSSCANLLHLLIIWLIISSPSPHNLYLLFSCILSILASIRLILMALFCATTRKVSVSLLQFPFLSHVHVYLYEMSLFNSLKCPNICFSLFLFSCYFCSANPRVVSIDFVVCDQ